MGGCFNPTTTTTKNSSEDKNASQNTLQAKKYHENDFDLIKLIGRGSFGKVFLVKMKETNKFYAMKILSKQMIDVRNQKLHTRSIIKEAERNILAKINSNFIVQLKYAFQSEDKLYLILEYINGGKIKRGTIFSFKKRKEIS